MATSAADVLSELVWAADAHSSRNCVQGSDGEIVRLDKALWEASPVLKKYSQVADDKFMRLSVPQSTVLALIEAHRNGNFPDSAEEFAVFSSLLGITSELGLKDLSSKCVDVMSKNREFLEMDYPAQCSEETVMLCFKTLLSSPLRTTAIYEQQLSRLARYSNNSRSTMMRAMDLVEESLKPFVEINLGAIPADFHVRSVPIVIHRRIGKLQTAVLHGSHLIPVDVFGKNFDLEAAGVESSFYLKYGSYILYKSGKNLYRKDLRSDRDPEQLFDDCELILTRGTYVFILRYLHKEGTRDSYSSVSLWTEDSAFVEIYRTRRTACLVPSPWMDFDRESLVFAICQSSLSPMCLFKLSGHNLILLNETESNWLHKFGAIMLRNQILVGSYKTYPPSNNQVLWTVETYNITDGNTDLQGEEQLTESVDWEDALKLMHAGERFFVRRRNRLYLVVDHLTPKKWKVVLGDGEFSALSELSMSL